VAAELSLTWRDVTDRFEAQRAIAESEERFRLLAQNATDIVAHVRHGTVVWMSPSVADQFRVAVEAWVGRSALELVHADDVAALQSALAAVDAGDTSTVRVRMQAPGGGTQHWVDARMQQYFDRDGRPDGLISSIRVVDDLVRAEAELDRRARYDDLTGLPNRGEAVATFARLTRRAQRTGERIAALFCDLDLFKSINDVHGHAAGDAVLATIAQRLTAGIRTDDTAARMGGDEFLALLVGVHGLDDATAVAEKLRESAQSPISYQGIDLQVTLSIGVALAEPGEDIDALMARADEAMYEAKKSGRNQVVAIA
jgi:diguanylate cyclase (GGDEF)-like protein/PAS domain S-box-containing protein